MGESLHIVCPHCAAVNRVPSDRLGAAPTCGQCHRPLFSGHPLETGEAAFEKHLARNDIPVLVDFWAPWCGPCRMAAPEVKKTARATAGRAVVVKVNTEDNPQLAARFGVQSIPTFMVFAGGRPVRRQAGVLPSQQLVQMVLPG